MIKGIEHFGMAAKDPANLVKWYEQHLNFKTLWKANETTFFILYWLDNYNLTNSLTSFLFTFLVVVLGNGVFEITTFIGRL